MGGRDGRLSLDGAIYRAPYGAKNDIRDVGSIADLVLVFLVGTPGTMVPGTLVPTGRERERDIFFSSLYNYTYTYVKSFLKIFRQRPRRGRMINDDRLPATPGSFLLWNFFLGIS